MEDLTEFQKKKLKILNLVSNPEQAQKNMNKYQKSLRSKIFIKVLPSTKNDKKFMILDPYTNKYVHFGSIFYEDFLKHKDRDRQMRYIKRFKNLLDANNKSLNNQYSPYNLSLYILWM
jgi:hypothetical protein